MPAPKKVQSSEFRVQNFLRSTCLLFISVIILTVGLLFVSAIPALAQKNCSDSGYYYYETLNKCVHKTGGYYDDTIQDCVYDFQTLSPVDENQCSIINAGAYQLDITPSPIPMPPLSLGASPAPGTQLTPPPAASPLIVGGGTPVDKDNYKAPQNANYTVLNLEHTFLCELAGTSPIDKCLGSTKGSDGKPINFLYEQSPGGGAMGALAGVIVTMYTPPTSSVQYLAGIIKNFGFAEPAYAQTPDVPGSGASIISPVFTLWQVVRNISYLAFILIFLGVGFMIMFRQKINPQTVVTAQAALPGLVIGLLLVTFSYLIAALIIDLAFFGIPLVTNIITQASPDNAFGKATDLNNLARDSNIFQMFFTTASHFGSNVGDVTGGTWDTLFGKTETWVGAGLISSVIGAIVGTFIFPGVGTLFGAGLGATLPFSLTGVIGLVVPLIIIIALFVQMFKLLLALISTYLQLLVATFTGPFVILASSLPGRGGGIGGWLKNLLGNALVFPAVFAAFLFAGLILSTTPESWKATPPLFGGLSTVLLRTLIAYGIILATPAIPDAVRGAFGIKPQQGGIVGAALGGFMAGANVGKAGAGKLTEPYRKRTEAYMSAQQKQLEGYPVPQQGTPWKGWMRAFGGRKVI